MVTYSLKQCKGNDKVHGSILTDENEWKAPDGYIHIKLWE